MQRRARVDHEGAREAVEATTASSSIRDSRRGTLNRYNLPLVLLLFGIWVTLFKNGSTQQEATVSKKLPPIIAADKDLFLCDRPNSTCYEFRPLTFFSENQPGNKYLDQLEVMGAELVNLPRMTYFTWSRGTKLYLAKRNITATCRHPLLGYLPSDVTYFHLRKTGGTSMHHAIGHVAKYIKSKGGIAKTKRHSTCRGLVRKKCQTEAMNHMKRIAQHQQGKTTRNHVVFAVIRDPVQRFISSMSQAMDVELGSRLRTACLDEESSNQTIRCVLDHLQNKGLKTDIHFCPMAINLYVLMRESDVQVSLFESKYLPQLLQFFGSSKLHMRDRSDQDYLNSKLLSTLTVQDLDPDMIRAICQLYAVDVDMMLSLGLDVPLCAT